MGRHIPAVRQDVLWIEHNGRGEPIRVDSPAWFTWLVDATAFTFTDTAGHFTARKERPSHGRGGRYWKAYRRRDGRLRRVYLGSSERLTLERLRQAAATLARSRGPNDDRQGILKANSQRARPATLGMRHPVPDDPGPEALVTPHPIRLRLLGDFQLSCGGQPVTGLTSERAQSLLAYLALHRDTPQTRQHVAFLFWPDGTAAQARNNLRQLVFQLRQTWPAVDRYLAVEPNVLFWRSDSRVQLDVADFDAAVTLAGDGERRADLAAARAALERAVSLYRGDLLPGCYDDWVIAERERLGQQYEQTLDRLIALLEQERDYATAIQHARGRLRHDVLNEETYRCLMRLHALNGSRASALRVYHACANMLRRELAIEPSPATRAVYDRLVRLEQAEVATSTPTFAGALPLVGRRREWVELQTAWRRAADGEPHLLLIQGEPGIGKSRLAEELASWAGRQGVGVAKTRAYAAEGQLAYLPVADWLRSAALRPARSRLDPTWLSEIARLLPELLTERPELTHPAPAAEHWQRQQFFQALARAVVAADQPLLLLLDDLQWCDQETLEWLHFLLRFDRQARLLVVGTARTEEVEATHPLARLLVDLRRGGLVSELTLEPLDPTEAAQLAVHVLGRSLAPDQVNHLYRETEGNPLFVVETARAGWVTAEPRSAAPRPLPAGRAATAVVARLPPKVHAVIAARLAQISPQARELAGLAATIGRAFTIPVLSAAYDGDERELIHGLDELWQRRVVREHGTDAYDFAHDKIREVAYTEISPARRRVLHRRVAQALEQVHATDLDRVSAQVAAHFDQADLPTPAVTYYLRAAAAAQHVYANQDAVDVLTRGLELLEFLPADRERDARELAIQTALGVSLVATRGYGASEVMAAYRRSRDLCQQLGQPPSPPVLRALAIASITHTEFRRAHELGDHLLRLAERDQDPVLLVEARYVLAMASFWTGAFGPSRAHLEQAVAAYRAAQSFDHVAHYTQDPGVVCLMRLALDLWLLGDPEQADHKRQQSLDLATALGHPFTLGYALAWDALLQVHQGQAHAARAAAEAAIELSREYRLDLWLSMATILRGWALAEVGDPEAGIETMRAGMATFRGTGSLYKRPFFLGLLAEQWGKLGHVEKGLSLLADALATVQTTGERWCEAELYRRQGALLHLHGETADADDALLRAVAVARQQAAKPLELRAAVELAPHWLRRGRQAEARTLLHDTLDTVADGVNLPELTAARSLLAHCR